MREVLAAWARIECGTFEVMATNSETFLTNQSESSKCLQSFSLIQSLNCFKATFNAFQSQTHPKREAFTLPLSLAWRFSLLVTSEVAEAYVMAFWSIQKRIGCVLASNTRNFDCFFIFVAFCFLVTCVKNITNFSWELTKFNTIFKNCLIPIHS